MQPFDLLGPLPAKRSTTVLEASAGTGKTLAIGALVTRFVAEGGATLTDCSRSPSALPQELRERVRQLVAAERALADPARSTGPPAAHPPGE